MTFSGDDSKNIRNMLRDLQNNVLSAVLLVMIIVVAILGLRSMYFLLADMADRFSLLKYGLALVLVFVGTKMLLIDLVKIPVLLSLGVVAVIIGGSVVLSLKRSARAQDARPAGR